MRTACLENSVTAALLLAFHGRQVTWRLGAATDPLRSHAWVENEQGISGEGAEVKQFIPLAQCPPHSYFLEER
jgi:hypothetical protein